MSYQLYISRQASKELAALEPKTLKRIGLALDILVQHPRPPKSKKLVGRSEYRVRVGDYRILYQILDEKILILVLHVAHRRDVYKS